MKKCKGCGITLQYTNPKEPGYTPKKDSDYCQRCFRLMHYDDLTISMRTGIDPEEVLKKVSEMDALIVWVVDLFDFEAGMLSGLNRLLLDKDIILAGTKLDLLPDTLSPEKLARFIFSRLKDQGIHVHSLTFISSTRNMGVDELKETILSEAKGRKVCFIGKANAGKSSLLNRLLGSNVLTTSRHPGTTLAFNEIEQDDITYVDTPGIELSHDMLMEVKESDLKTIVPNHAVKPIVYQLYNNQTFMIGGLARIDLSVEGNAGCVFYMSDALKIHRTKTANANEQWQKHYGELFRPVPLKNHFKKYETHKRSDKMDIVIDGLGWVCLSGAIGHVSVYVPENVSITFRKAMI